MTWLISLACMFFFCKLLNFRIILKCLQWGIIFSNYMTTENFVIMTWYPSFVIQACFNFFKLPRYTAHDVLLRDYWILMNSLNALYSSLAHELEFFHSFISTTKEDMKCYLAVHVSKRKNTINTLPNQKK